ncbi:branched-chain amino acid ABC transporter permease [Ancylobacter sonchi]|uniref:branched-chain amino acid ABC transporter permease n=1 Tax=Ancylobacter sonchi TaxID=1937790 RepID=UPI001BD2F927|nr:branched-chain amino acid ABC transporter permease [Ancylobacter sonchi]MBS7533687.1 branched-chain amino acid ABC transporter permease [Ancylobacter sonchi]
MSASARHSLLPLLIGAGFVLVPLITGGDVYAVNLAIRIMCLAIAAIGLDLILGYGRLVSFGHAAFFGAGAYAVGILSTHGFTSAPLLIGAAILAGAALALPIGAVSLRTRGVYFIMITLAFGQMLFFTATSLSAYGGDDGLSLPARATFLGTDPFGSPLSFHYVVLALLALVYLGGRVLVASRFGRVLRAGGEDERRVIAAGFPITAYRLVAFVIAGGIAGLAGGLYAEFTEFVSPAYLSWQRSGEFIVMVVLGGTGSLHGAVLGAAGVVLLEEWLAEFTEHWRLIFGPLLVLAALAGRDGLARLLGRGKP